MLWLGEDCILQHFCWLDFRVTENKPTSWLRNASWTNHLSVNVFCCCATCRTLFCHKTVFDKTFVQALYRFSVHRRVAYRAETARQSILECGCHSSNCDFLCPKSFTRNFRQCVKEILQSGQPLIPTDTVVVRQFVGHESRDTKMPCKCNKYLVNN